MTFIMISVAYGITYMLEDPFPIPPYYILFIFSIGFVLFSVYIERERDNAMFPLSLLGGAIASGIFTFLITAAVGGMKYIWEKGFTALGEDTVIYSVSTCIILSMILFKLAKHKL